MPVRRYPRLLEQFLESEAKGGLVLFLAALLAFILANTPAATVYFGLREVLVGVRFGEFSFLRVLLDLDP